MMGLRRHRQHFARFVAAVLLVAALAPAMSRGLAFMQGSIAPWAPLCSTSQQASTGLGDGWTVGQADGDAAGHLLQHCALCHLTGGDAPILPLPPMAPVLSLPVAHIGLPALAWQAPRPLPAWAAPPGQAPPLAC